MDTAGISRRRDYVIVLGTGASFVRLRMIIGFVKTAKDFCTAHPC